MLNLSHQGTHSIYYNPNLNKNEMFGLCLRQLAPLGGWFYEEIYPVHL